MPQTFDKLSMKLIEYGRAVPARLADFIDMIFTKALDEPTYSPVYARLYVRLAPSTLFPLLLGAAVQPSSPVFL